MDRSDLLLDALRKLCAAVLEPDAWQRKALPAPVAPVGGGSRMDLFEDVST
ncbi:MAG: hypothetical protein LCH93_06900 [Proteobacteria bacterium]|nr:hypothetical protein [Pseudomonadota bacterium]